MAQAEQPCECIVLKKTKLGESDLIIHGLAKDGSQVRCVAKGARKPTNANSSRLELLNTVQGMLVHGKNLDIIKDTKLVKHHRVISEHPLRFNAACLGIEPLDASIQQDLPVESLFDMTSSYLSYLEQCPEHVLSLSFVAYWIKLISLLGFRPSFSHCVACGKELPCIEAKGGAAQAFSFEEGGVVCEVCSEEAETVHIERQLLIDLNALLYARFTDIDQLDISCETKDALTSIAYKLICKVIGKHLKSMRLYQMLAT